MNPLKEITSQLDTAIVTVRRSLDRDARAKEREAFLAPFFDKWRYAPVAEKERAAKKIADDQDKRSGEALYTLGRLIREHAPVLDATVNDVRRAPTPEQVWRNRAGTSGMSAEASLLLEVLNEQRTTRLRTELSVAPPAVWREQYEHALTDATDQANATTIRVVEDLLSGTAWRGAAVNLQKDAREGSALLGLRRRVEDAKHARVTPELRDALQALGRAKSYERECEIVHHLTPRNPEIEGVRPAVTA